MIVVEIPIEALARFKVAAALSELTLALGGHAPELAPPIQVASDARLETALAANDDKATSPSTGQEDDNPTRTAFYAYLRGRKDTKVVLAQEVVNFYLRLEVAADEGLSTGQVLEAFSLLPKGASGKVLGGIFGGLLKGLQNRNMDLPHESRDGRYYIKPWPKA